MGKSPTMNLDALCYLVPSVANIRLLRLKSALVRTVIFMKWAG